MWKAGTKYSTMPIENQENSMAQGFIQGLEKEKNTVFVHHQKQ